MFHHVILAYETLVAYFTNVRFCAGVQTHVSSQIGFMIELFNTLVALEWLVAIVFGHVLRMRLIAWKAFATPLAFEWLFTAVECFIVLC